MNMKKINKFILDEFDKNAGADISIGDYEDRIFVTNGFVGFLIDKDKFIFDKSKITTRTIMSEKQIREFFNSNYHTKATVSGEIKVVGKSEKIGLMPDNKSEMTYVTRKYLKLFDKEHTYRVNGKSKPVVVFEGYKEVAIIMPVRV